MFLHLSVILLTGGVYHHHSEQTPPLTVNVRTLRILLECILVSI